MMTLRRSLTAVVLAHALLAPALRAEEHRVAPGEDWARLAARARPGDHIVLAPGLHRPASIQGLTGSPGAPIVIRSEDPDSPAIIAARNSGLHLQRPAWVVLEDLTVEDAAQNGINIDDQDGSGVIGEPWDAHLVLRRVTVRRTGPVGNFDGVKLSGLRGVRLEECTVEGWGGSAVDMVGCHDVLIDRCVFRGLDGFSQDSGVQAKGGSADVLISNCRFLEAGMRAVNLGGSTGLRFFRPPVPDDAAPASRYEAERVSVQRCVFQGGDAAVAVVGARGGEIRDCTILHPAKWPFRLLQETTDARFGPSEGPLVTGCIIITDTTAANIGPGTDPDAFRFGANIWWEIPEDALGALPGRVQREQLRLDPRLDDDLRPRAPAAGEFGAVR